jgi:hypothetical protein
MNLARTIVLASAAALGAAAAHADTRSSDEGKATMERKASPAAPGKQDEERTQSHSQPDVPTAGGTTPGASKPKAKKSSDAKKKDKTSSSTGSNAPAAEPALDAVSEQRFKALDIDGDGAVSKAESAGNADIVKDFDRADRNHDGKLSRAEYGLVGKLKTAKKQQASR